MELHYIKKKSERMEVSYGDHKMSIKCLRTKIRLFITKEDFCYVYVPGLQTRMTRLTKTLALQASIEPKEHGHHGCLQLLRHLLGEQYSNAKVVHEILGIHEELHPAKCAGHVEQCIARFTAHKLKRKFQIIALDAVITTTLWV